MKIAKIVSLIKEKTVASNSRFLTYEVVLDDGGKGILKLYPKDYSRWYQAAVAVYEISKMLKLGVIPESVLFVSEDKLRFPGKCYGYVTRYVKGLSRDKDKNFSIAGVNELYLQKLAILDFIAMNIDRGTNNVVVSGKKCFGIDNDSAFLDPHGISLNIKYILGKEIFKENKPAIIYANENRQEIYDKLSDLLQDKDMANWCIQRIRVLYGAIDKEFEYEW